MYSLSLALFRKPAATDTVVVSKIPPSTETPLIPILSSATTSTSSSTLAVDGFARIGARAALSFAFAFLRRVWRTEEDSGLCDQVSRNPSKPIT